MNTSIQHGENVLVPIAKMPEGEVTKSKSVIVGHSETGHHHVLTSIVDIDSLEYDGNLHIEITVESSLSHKKAQDSHDTIPVKPGCYRVHHKTEYNPVDKVLTAVFD